MFWCLGSLSPLTVVLKLGFYRNRCLEGCSVGVVKYNTPYAHTKKANFDMWVRLYVSSFKRSSLLFTTGFSGAIVAVASLVQ